MRDPDLLASLRRWPDLESPDLPAVDAADRLLLDESEPLLHGVSLPEVAVIGDAYGAVTLSLLAASANAAASVSAAADGSGAAPAATSGGLRVHQDSLLGERALLANAERLGLPAVAVAHHDLGPELLSGARVVLLRLPRSLAALEEVAQLVVHHAGPEVHLVAAGRLKYMTHAMNAVLERSFTRVTASLARQKSRVLHAAGPRRPAPPLTHPVVHRVTDSTLGLDLVVVARGGVFAGATLDVGTRFLLSFADRMAPRARTAVDLGCGTGLIAAYLARTRPALEVTALDVSAAAVASARATAAANGLVERIGIRRADGLRELPDSTVDLVVCNPPFHAGAALAPEAGLRLLADARRVLRPGGELWTVYNSRLAHARALRRLVGPTEVVGDNGPFTVARTTVR